MPNIPMPNDWETLEPLPRKDSSRLRIQVVMSAMGPFRDAIMADPASRRIAVEALKQAASNRDLQSALMIADYAIASHFDSLEPVSEAGSKEFDVPETLENEVF